MMLPPVVGGWTRVLAEPAETKRRELTHESNQRVARPIGVESACVDVLGTTVQFLMQPDDEPGMPCIIRRTIPPATVVPMHSHPDPETCFMISGNAEGLAQTDEGFQWIRLSPDDVFHVPSGAKQAFRNHWPEPAVMIAIALLGKLGFAFTFVALTIFLIVALDRRSPLLALAVGIGLAAAFHILFVVALDVSLPKAVWGF